MGYIRSNNYSDKYITTLSEKGMLFFIKPQKMPRIKGYDAVKDMEYDITYITNTDSVSYTISIYTKTPIKTDSVEILYNGNILKEQLEKIYIEPNKSKWESRLRFRIPYHVFKSMYQLTKSFQFKFSDDKHIAFFFFDSSKWEKEKKKMNSIIGIIDYNNE